MTPDGEVLLVPFFGQGHLFPCMELCKHMCTRNYKTTLLISSNLSSSVPSPLRSHPLVEIAEISNPPPAPPPPEATQGPGPEFGPDENLFHRQNLEMGREIELFLEVRVSSQTRPVCAIIDVMMSWSKELFFKFDILTVSFFTSAAVSAAMEYATWKAGIDDMSPGQVWVLPGLPEDMAVTYLETKRRPHGPGGPPPGPGGPGGPRPPGRRPPGPSRQPRWVDEVEGSIALLINTCTDLERPFLEYVAEKIKKPVWGVGPLLPDEYWKSVGSILHDRDIRPNKRESNYTEDEVIQWLDSKPRGSVIYVSFGTEVGPTLDEYGQLADALEDSNWPFIWVIQRGAGTHGPPPGIFDGKKSGSIEEGEDREYFPHGLKNKVGDRGLIIHGWAPQLMILSHSSTGGFLSHCGWNSTVEAIGKGVPFLAWPIRGDQFYDAKLVVCHLGVGYMVSNNGDVSEGVKKEEIVKGIESLMNDEGVHKRAAALGGTFEAGFPASSKAALDAFIGFIRQ